MATGTVTALGIGSNVLTSDMIDKLRNAERQSRVTPLVKKAKANLDKQSSLTKLMTLFNALNSSAKKLSDTSTYLERSSTVSGKGVSATIGAGLPIQDITVRVNQLAKGDINQVGTSYASRDSVFSSINSVLKFHAGGKDYSVKIRAGMTLGEVAQSITDATGGKITGVVMKTGGSKPYQLMINSKNTGSDSKIYFGSTLTSNALRAGKIEASNNGDFTVTLKDKNGVSKTLNVTVPATATNSDAQGNAAAIQKAIKDAIAADSDFAGLENDINVGISGEGKRVVINDRRGHDVKVGGSKAGQFGFTTTETGKVNTVEGNPVSGGKLTGKLTIGDVDLDLSTITSDGNNGQQNAEAVRDKINSSSSEYTASVKNGRLIINKNDGGQVQVVVKGADKSPEQAASRKAIASLGLTAGAHQSYEKFQESTLKLKNIQAAQDAKFIYNGISITRGSNSVSDVISGVNLELTAVHKDTDSPSVIRVTRNNKSVFDEVKSFVETFNQLMNKLNEEMKYDADTKIAGNFQGDGDLRSLRTALNALISYSNGDRDTLFKYGVSLNDHGKMTLDAEKLKKAFEENPERAIAFFKGTTRKINGKEVEEQGVFSRFRKTLDGYVTGGKSKLKLLEKSLSDEGKRLSEEKKKAESDIKTRYESLTARFIAYDAMIAKINRSFGALDMMIKQSMK